MLNTAGSRLKHGSEICHGHVIAMFKKDYCLKSGFVSFRLSVIQKFTDMKICDLSFGKI